MLCKIFFTKSNIWFRCTFQCRIERWACSFDILSLTWYEESLNGKLYKAHAQLPFSISHATALSSCSHCTPRHLHFMLDLCGVTVYATYFRTWSHSYLTPIYLREAISQLSFRNGCKMDLCCKNNPNSFCYVCGVFPHKKKR